jgi:hypothetical protein
LLLRGENKSARRNCEKKKSATDHGSII